MGVADFLPRALSAAGTDVDLRNYRNGIDTVVMVPSKKRKSSSNTNKKRNGRHYKRRKRRRPLRIAVDVSHWIYRACHRFGSMLADENHLTNYGRYQLVRNTMRAAGDNNENNNNNNNIGSQEEKKDESPVTHDNNRQKTDTVRKYIASCCLFVIERLQSLQKETNAEILVVLDGATPPIKLTTVKKRSDARKENVRLRDAPINVDNVSRPSVATDRNNNNSSNSHNDTQRIPTLETELQERMKATRRAGAGKWFSSIIEELLEAMRLNQIPFLVAPYEADGQLAWLSMKRLVDLVITEDSDLVAQGGVCMMYKMDLSPITANNSTTTNNTTNNEGGSNRERLPREEDNNEKDTSVFSFAPKGKMLLKSDMGAITVSRSSSCDGRHLTLQDMSDAVLAVMFVAAGSDYCESLKGIGLVSACEIVHKSFLLQNKTPPLKMVFDMLFKKTFDKSLRDDVRRQEEYKEKFLKALLMYRHPVVYSPFVRRFITAGEPNGDPEFMSYQPYKNLFENKHLHSQIVGDMINGPMATWIAEGWVSPRTKQLYDFAKNDNKLPKSVKKHFEGDLTTNIAGGNLLTPRRNNRRARDESEDSEERESNSQRESQLSLGALLETQEPPPHLPTGITEDEAVEDTPADSIQLETQEVGT